MQHFFLAIRTALHIPMESRDFSQHRDLGYKSIWRIEILDKQAGLGGPEGIQGAQCALFAVNPRCAGGLGMD